MCHYNKNYVLDMSYKLERDDFLLSKIVAVKLASNILLLRNNVL
jgi:hypothetical protein